MSLGNHYLRCACVAFGVFLVSCSTTTSPNQARLANGRYYNQFFDFQVKIPNGWTIGSEETFQMAENAMKPERLHRAEDKKIEHHLLLISEFPAGFLTPTGSNPAVVLVAVDLRGKHSDPTSEEAEREIAQQAVNQLHWKEVNTPAAVKLGSKTFYRTDFELSLVGHKMREALFLTIENRYILNLMITAGSEADVNGILGLIGYPIQANVKPASK